MIDRKIGPIKILKGLQKEIESTVIDEGFLIYSIDKKRVYMSDGVTKGSIPVSNKNHIVLIETTEVPNQALYGDIVYNADTKFTSIVGYDTDGKTLKLIPIYNDDGFGLMEKKVDDLYAKYSLLSACIEDPNKVDKICKC